MACVEEMDTEGRQSLLYNRIGTPQDNILASEPAAGTRLSDRRLRCEAAVTGCFNGARNVTITSSNFTYTNNNSNEAMTNAFEQIQKRVATSALHESAGVPFETGCHSGTRDTLLDTLINNINRAADLPRAENIMWINGAAGSGKTAIAHSVAERCVERGIIVTTFFFGRLDSTRNSIASVVPTIAYQLIQQVPAAKRVILSRVADNPLIFSTRFDVQFQKLVIEPLQHVERTRKTPWSILLLFDALDECSGMEPHQTFFIRAIAEHVRSITLPLTVLITSRPELRLSMQFTSEGNLVRQVALDTSYPAHDDIRHFLKVKFNVIKATHPSKEDIAASGSWPSVEDIEKVVDQGSGQFIHATVVMDFVSDPHSFPPRRLDIALSQKTYNSSTPFPWTPLDSMYSHIFSRVEDLPRTKLLISVVIFAKIVSLPEISSFVDISVPIIRTILGGLASVLKFQGDNLVLLHASLPGFLLDEVRSQAYHINPKEWQTRLCIISLRRFAAHSKDWDPSIFLELFSGSQGSPELRDCISNFNPCAPCCSTEFRSEYIKVLENMDFSDEGKIYRRHGVLTSSINPMRLAFLLDGCKIAFTATYSRLMSAFLPFFKSSS